MAFNKRSDLASIIDGSFDAGFLIDARTGRVKHANEPAFILFDIEDRLSRFQLDKQIEFWTYANGEFITRDPQPFREVVHFLGRGEAPSEWMVTCFTSSGDSFVGAAKLTKLSGSDGHNYIIAYVRSSHRDGEDNRRARYEIVRTFEESEDAMLAIDENGRILMFNQHAIEMIDWCDEDLVGEHISKCLRHHVVEASLEPILTIDHEGVIVSVNESAADQIPWAGQDLVGTHLLDRKPMDTVATEDRSMNSSFDSKGPAAIFSRMRRRGLSPPSIPEPPRKRSPAVLRVFVERQNDDDSATRGGSTTFASESIAYGKAESMMVAVVEASLDPLFQINEQGVIQMVNKAAVRQFGYSRDEMIGSNISIIVGGGHSENHDKYIERYLETGVTRVIGKKRELAARRSDGTEFPIELGVVEVDTFAGEERLFAGFVHDLSTLKKEQRLTADIVNACLDPLFVINETGAIKLCNAAASAKFGWSKEEFLNSNISVIAGGGHSKNHDSYLRAYLETGKTNVIGKLRELPGRRKDGSEFPIQLGVVEMNTEGDEERLFVGFVHDLTELKQREGTAKGIIEASRDPMFQIDDHGTIELVNESACRVFGWSRDEFVGNNIKMIVPMSHASKHDDYLKRFRETGRLHLVGKRRELTARSAQGKEFPIEIYVEHIKDHYSKRSKFVGFVRDLTEAKKQESISRGLIDSSVDPIFLIDKEGVILRVNQAAVDTFGYARHEFVGSNVSIICGGTHGQRHDSYLKRYIETNEARVIGKKRQLPARRKSGDEFTIELAVVKVETGGETYFCGYARDMSDILTKQSITTGIIEASFDPMFMITDKGIISMANEAATREFQWTQEELLGSNISLVVGREHSYRHDQYIQAYLQTGIAKVIGKKRELKARRKDGTEFAIELGIKEVKNQSQDGTRMFAGFIRNIQGVKKHEEEMRTRQRSTLGILDASIDPIFQISEKGIILATNKAASRLFGWSEEEFLGSNISIIVGEAHAANHDEYLRRYLETGVAKVMGKSRRLKARMKYGGEVDIELSLAEVETNAGQSRIFCGFIRDITSKVQQEQESLKRERLVEGILRSSHDPVFVIDQYGIIQTTNEAATKMFQYSREEFLGSNITLIVGKEHASKHDQYLKNFLTTGVAKVMGKRRELRARRKDRKECTIELFLSEIETSSSEKRLFVGYVHSLSHVKRQEHKIQRERRLMEGMINASLDPMFQIDENCIILTCNASATTLFGWDRREFLGQNVSMIVGKEHASRHDEYIRRYLKTGEARVIGKKRELQARHKDGFEFPIELSLSEIATNKGEKRLFAGFVRDLTETKVQEAEIDARDQLMEALVNAYVDPIFVIDATGKIMMTNKAATQVFGYTSAEFLGNNIKMICGSDHGKYHDQYLQEYLETGESGVLGQRRILPATHKDGNEFEIELTVVEVLMGGGEKYFCGYVRRLEADRSYSSLDHE